jgi:hypothetical protein
MDRIPATPVTNKTERYARYGQGEPEGSLSFADRLLQRLPKSKSHKMPREGYKWRNMGACWRLWKSVEKTPILQSINYQAIIKTVEMVEK